MFTRYDRCTRQNVSWIEVRLQFFDRLIVRFAFERGGDDRNHAFINGGVHDILRVHDEAAPRAFHQDLGALLFRTWSDGNRLGRALFAERRCAR